MKVLKGSTQWKNIEGHWCCFKERSILNDKEEVVWYGKISDAGAFEAEQYEYGMAIGYQDYPDFVLGKKLAKLYNITMEELIEGSDNQDV